jgi:outer membrane protein assembly factor BamE (lipoprotein component of BamABCDE complex)
VRKIYFLSLLSLSACETTIVNHGHIAEVDDFKKIVVGKDSVNSVFGSLGTPTMISSIPDKNGGFSWYYVSKVTKKTSFWDPKVIDYRTVAVTFGKEGIVRSIAESTYEKPVPIVSEKTKTKGKTAGVFGETFAGVGRYMKHYMNK